MPRLNGRHDGRVVTVVVAAAHLRPGQAAEIAHATEAIEGGASRRHRNVPGGPPRPLHAGGVRCYGPGVGKLATGLGLATLLAAQIPADQPVIRVTTRLVEVNVVARDRAGSVRNLTKDDFTVLDNGQRRTLAVFEKKMRPAGAARPELAAGGGTAITNRVAAAPGASEFSTVLLLDALNSSTEDQLRARNDVLRFLRQTAAGERVAIFTLGGTPQLEQDFTGDSAALERTINRVRWGAGYLWPEAKKAAEAAELRANAASNAELARLTEAVRIGFAGPNTSEAEKIRTHCVAMVALAKYLGRVPGRKNLLWLTSAFPLALWSAEPLLVVDEVSQVNHAFSDAQVAVYPVDVRGLMVLETQMFRAPLPGEVAKGFPGGAAPATGGPGPLRKGGGIGPSGIETMNYIAHYTGGRPFYDANDLTRLPRTAAEDADVYYTLAFYPDSRALDSRRHSLKVEVARKTATVDDPAARIPEPAQISEALWSRIEEQGLGLGF